MRALTLALVLVVIASQVCAQSKRPKKKPSGFDKLVQTIFPKHTPTPAPRTRSKKKKAAPTVPTTPTPSSPRRYGSFYIVDAQWRANYLEQVEAWGYPIPEERYIWFYDGNYYVPPVVYRHYEDMVNTPRPESRLDDARQPP